MYRLTCLLLLKYLICVHGDTYSARVSTQEHINEVGDNFLSFSIDPKYLFSSNNHNSQECMCMASSLSPAYIRIAGPSTSSLNFVNSSIVIADDDEQKTQNQGLRVTDEQWHKFSTWAKASNFKLVFALNPAHKSLSNMWDANSAISILTAAEQHHIEHIVWELGYECTNQSIEEYLNDLQTLKVIVETFPRGADQSWKAVAGDVTNCIQEVSKSDFKDYITLSNDLMDAILLNGKTTAQELEKLSESDRVKLLSVLSKSNTPLWLTEKSAPQMSELDRAVDWLISLGYAARNGFNVHFRELREDELHEPTLSFYMALLYKNLVGERVLNVEVEGSGRAALFAHCTSLRHRPVSAAVTLYGANMDEEAARFSVKLSRTEEGGDIMQFIVGKDANGTIIVNGRAMYNEGDIRPVVKRVRPYKTLLLNLPPKSYGFWVLANTNIEACHDFETNEINGKNFVQAVPVTDIKDKVISDKAKRIERSIIKDTNRNNIPIEDVTDYSEEESYDGEIDISTPEVDSEMTDTSREELISLVDNIGKNIKEAFPELVKKWHRNSIYRYKRDTDDKPRDIFKIIDKEFKRLAEKHSEKIKPLIVNKVPSIKLNRTDVLSRLFEKNKLFQDIRKKRQSILKKHKLYKNKLAKRNTFAEKTSDKHKDEMKNRTRRNIIAVSNFEDTSDVKGNKLYKIFKTLKKTVNEIPIEVGLVEDKDAGSERDLDEKEESDLEEELDVKEDLDSNQSGLLIKILDSASSLLDELRERMSKVWSIMESMETKKQKE